MGSALYYMAIGAAACLVVLIIVAVLMLVGEMQDGE